jgi:outer membrane protein TolC
MEVDNLVKQDNGHSALDGMIVDVKEGFTLVTHSLFLCLLYLLSSCASYQAKPLNTRPALLKAAPHLSVNAGQIPLPGLEAHPFNPDNGLDMAEVAILAVMNNPDLKVERDELSIAQAELMATEVLPNPQVTAGLDHPTNGGLGIVNAFSAGLSYDIGALLTHNASVNSFRANSLKLNLTVLWKEWQVVQQARLLFISSIEQQKMMQELKIYHDLLDTRYQRARQALQEGDLTIDTVSADLTALQDANTSINELERQMSKTHHDLNTLLDLSPDIRLNLVGNVDLPEPDRTKIETDLAQLPSRRPDLLALQAGYKSQEERLRKAVLAQFPGLTIGVIRARDTTGIYTSGIGISVSLPIFDRNQGPIAIEKATRKRLYDEYQARLNKAYSEVKSLVSQSNQVNHQYEEVIAILPEMEGTAARAQAALDAGNLDITTYTNLQAAALKKHLEAIALERTLFGLRIALQTLLGADLPGQIVPATIQLDERGK